MVGQTRFENREFYKTSDGYRLLPFQFLQFDSDRKFIVNEVGEHLFLGNDDFDLFVSFHHLFHCYFTIFFTYKFFS